MQALNTAAMGQIRSGGDVKAVVLAADVKMKESIFGYHVRPALLPHLSASASPPYQLSGCI